MSWNNKIEFGKLTKQIDYSGYSVEMKGAPDIFVWVNLDKMTMDEFHGAERENVVLAKKRLLIDDQIQVVFDDMQKVKGKDAEKLKEKLEGLGEELKALTPKMKVNNTCLYDWYAKIWSQHEDESTHVTGKQVEKFAADLLEAQPAFWDWIQRQTQFLITEHNNQHLKN